MIRRSPWMFVGAGLLGAALCMVPPPAHAQVCALPGSQGDVASVSGVVNTYWTPAAGSYGPGSTVIALGGQRGAPATLAEGDLLLVIQMQCADIDFSDGPTYGSGTAGEPASGYTNASPGCAAGRHQFVRAGAGSSNASLSLAGSPLTAAYEQSNATATRGRRTFQVIRVPQYANATLGGTVTAPVWDGFSGGVVVLDAAFTLNLNGQLIDVDGAGFRGGSGRNRSSNDGVERFRWDADTRHGTKGEGIAGTPRFVSEKRSVDDGTAAPVTDLGADWGGYPTGTSSTGDFARGAPGTAGGGGTFWGGNSDNGGGGGGGNGQAGGRGGVGWRGPGYAGVLADYSDVPEKKWGFGGAAFAQNGIARVVLGGGGGAGDNNNNSANNVSSGAAGGGIVMLRAVTLAGSGTIRARGARAADNPNNDGAGGGGAGGSVVVVATTWSAALAVDVSGGRGGDAFAGGNSAHGPGGGGGAGVVITTAPVALTAAGGAPGVTNTAQGQPGGANHGAQSGGAGSATLISPASDTPGVTVGRTCKSDLRLTKTNTPGVNGDVDQTADSLASGATVAYAVTVANDGPLPANGSVVSDPAPTNLLCATATCAAAGGAACPTTTGAALVAALQGTGVVVPTLPVGGNVVFTLDCSVP